MQTTLEFLDLAARKLRLPKRAPHELVLHWRRSRSADWLERNPLIMVRAVNASGGYYENEHLLTARLKAAVALMAMLSTSQPRVTSRGQVLFSTAQVNNFQTLNIHHYMALSSSYGSAAEMTGDFVPVNLARPGIVALSDLRVDLIADYWRNRRSRADRLAQAVTTVYRGYLRYSLGGADGGRARANRKAFESMAYFRRSFSPSENRWQEVVSLATAFEFLLTDRYERGVTDRLMRRSRNLLKGTAGRTALEQAISDLYTARSHVVHGDVTQVPVDLEVAREAYVRCFTRLALAMPRLSTNPKNPMADLTDDRL